MPDDPKLINALRKIQTLAEEIVRNYVRGDLNRKEEMELLGRLEKAVKAARKAEGQTFTVEAKDYGY